MCITVSLIMPQYNIKTPPPPMLDFIITVALIKHCPGSVFITAPRM